MSESRIAVIGLGYVGQPLVAALANVGYRVIGVDVDRDKVARLAAGHVPTLFEPGLAETFARCRDRIAFTTSYEDALDQVEAVCITVGTPVDPEGRPDSAALDAAVRGVGARLRRGYTIVLRSTVPPGTTLAVARALEAQSGLRAGEEFYVAFCPERTIEGIALYELYNLPIIVGGINPASSDRAAALFRRLGTQVVTVSSPTAAELCKLADNMYRAINIAFANEFGNVCERARVDAYEVVRAVNAAYPRTHIFRPGLGADGPCLSKDPLILRSFAAAVGAPTPLLDASVEINSQATRRVAREIEAFLDAHPVRTPRIAFLGLAFKGMPETDDLRGSAALLTYAALTGPGPGEWRGRAEFRFFDPIVREFNGHTVSARLDMCLRGAHVVAFLSDHPSLRHVPLELILEHTARPLLLIDAWHNVAVEGREALPPDVTYVLMGGGL